MKREFGYSDGHSELVIYSHKNLFYLKRGNEKLAKSDEMRTLRAYIDGYSLGNDAGAEKWARMYREIKHQLRMVEMASL